jgi:dipeptidyl aminopeptidase/acylaminoacyl peptidase
MLRRSFLLLLSLAMPVTAGAQSARRPLDHDVYDLWNRIGSWVVSSDGEWLAYPVTPGHGDSRLEIRGLEDGQAATLDRGVDPAITPDSRFVVFTIEPFQAVVDSLKREGSGSNDLPKDSLGVLALSDLSDPGLEAGLFRAGTVKSWKVPEDAGSYVAYLLEEEPDSASEAGEEEEAGPRTGRRGRPGGGRGSGSGPAGEDEERKDQGTSLVLRTLDTGQETRFEDVVAYEFTNDGAWLVYTASNEDGTADGVFAVVTQSGEVTPILTGEGEYTQLALSDEDGHVAFVTNRDDWEADQPAFALYHALLGETEARPVALEGTPGIPAGWWVSEHGDVSFSDEGSRLFFGTAPRPEPEPEDTIPDDEKVVVDIWNWKDPLIQPMQLVQANQERNRTYRAYASTVDFTVVQLANEEMRDITISEGGDGRWALGVASLKYGHLVSHDATYSDLYRVDMETGEAEVVVEKLRGRGGGFSPEGRYLTFWDGAKRAWMVTDMASLETRNVTEDLPYPVHDELDDHPQDPPSYGSAGWLEEDEAFLVYDRFDIWAVDPAGAEPPRNLTEGVGRASDMRFRYVDPEGSGGGRSFFGFRGGGGDAEGIPTDEDVLLTSFQIYTKDAGFYRDRFDRDRDPERLLEGAFDYSDPRKAEDADVYVLTRQSFEEFPDLWVTGPDFGDMERISDANPQQAEYLWGTPELVGWTSNDRIPLQGILIKPEGFDPSRMYPMMVYFYERSSDGLHRYRTPGPGGSSISLSFYASRGYVVFVPDIPYEIGHPGESAIDAVVPGVLKILDDGYVDPDRIGVQGHSWGGYQIAYMVTRTNLFAAAEAGAPVSNMTSAYGGIRWQTGMSRQFQYERTQSRLGGSLWEETLRYINNSPLFEADKVQTPVLMLHNDEDGAVPWYQGIEYFMALRRLQKPVWLLNYNGEAHGNRRRPNQKDWMIRMQQFFDHYLMDAPAPVWMERGVPAVMKGKTLGLDLVKGGGA